MKINSYVTAICIAAILVIPVTATAVQTPSPRPTTSAKQFTQPQKEAIAAARAAFADAKNNAMQGFDRAVADAQAIREQAIADAGTNQIAIRLAKKEYGQSYQVILRALKADLAVDRSILAKAIAAAKTR